MRRSTKKIEFVEAANIAKSFRRIYRSPQGTRLAVNRALYHAYFEAGVHQSWDDLRKLREALGLP